MRSAGAAPEAGCSRPARLGRQDKLPTAQPAASHWRRAAAAARPPREPWQHPASRPGAHLLGGLNVQHVQDHGLVGAQHDAARNHGADGVANLAGRAGHQDALGGRHGACGGRSVHGSKEGGRWDASAGRQAAADLARAAAADEWGEVLGRPPRPPAGSAESPGLPGRGSRIGAVAAAGQGWGRMGAASPPGHQPWSEQPLRQLAARSTSPPGRWRSCGAPVCWDRVGNAGGLCDRGRGNSGGQCRHEARGPDHARWGLREPTTQPGGRRQRRADGRGSKGIYQRCVGTVVWLQTLAAACGLINAKTSTADAAAGSDE